MIKPLNKAEKGFNLKKKGQTEDDDEYYEEEEA